MKVVAYRKIRAAENSISLAKRASAAGEPEIAMDYLASALETLIEAIETEFAKGEE